MLFVFLNKPRNLVKIWYWERNGFCLWLKRLVSERFKTSPDHTDGAIVLTVQGKRPVQQPVIPFPASHAVPSNIGEYMKPPATLSARRAFWAEHVLAWRSSGLNQVACCEQHQLNAKSFGYWFRSRELENETLTLVSVTVQESAQPSELLLRRLGGLELVLPCTVEPACWPTCFRRCSNAAADTGLIDT